MLGGHLFGTHMNKKSSQLSTSSSSPSLSPSSLPSSSSTSSSSSLDNSCLADICLADTRIKSDLIGQNVGHWSGLHLSCIGVDYNDGEDCHYDDEYNECDANSNSLVKHVNNTSFKCVAQ